MKPEIMDTTLRDGEQTHGVSFTSEEKLAIAAKLLEELNVDRIEVASAKVSDGEAGTLKKICDWAEKNNHLEKIEVLGFVDHDKSADWLRKAGCRTMNLLAKGSKKHCEIQLKKTPEQHFEDIRKTVAYAHGMGLTVNVYLEDWSHGIIDSEEYVFSIANHLSLLKVKRIMLPDTLGILDYEQSYRYVKMMKSRFPDAHFDFHAHNDYGMATANTLAAYRAGADGFHVTVNYMGERTGNACLDEVAVAMKDFCGIDLGINEKKLKELSRLVETFSGRKVSGSKPITGDDVFTNTAGIHADGDKKGDLYVNSLTPERFARKRVYALGKLSGKASLEMNLREIGIVLSEEQKKEVLDRVIYLGDRKKVITPEDLPFIISDVLRTPQAYFFKVINYRICSGSGEKPAAEIEVSIQNKLHKLVSEGNGGYDAFMNCVKKLEPELKFTIPELKDYSIRIPPGGETDALVEATILWKDKEKEFSTAGVDSDQVAAAIKATEKMMNMVKR